MASLFAVYQFKSLSILLLPHSFNVCKFSWLIKDVKSSANNIEKSSGSQLYKSFTKIMNRITPSIEPCKTDISSSFRVDDQANL